MAYTEKLRLIAKRYVESTGVDCALSEAKAMSAPRNRSICMKQGTRQHDGC